MELIICTLIGVVTGAAIVAAFVIPARVRMSASLAKHDQQWQDMRRQSDDNEAVYRRQRDETNQEVGALWKQVRDIEASLVQKEGSEMSQIRDLLTGLAPGNSRRQSNHPPVGSEL